MDIHVTNIKFPQLWVRKLTGKPGGDTSPDCEFDARRIHSIYEPDSVSLAAASKAFLTHSDLLCGAVYRETVPVHEVFRGETVWQGEVEVFDLHDHHKAKRAYAWSHREGPDDAGERFVAVLEIPPVESAVTAVQASIMADAKKRKK